MAQYRVSGDDMVSVADAIRTKGGTSESLSFPDGFVNAIDAISTGGAGIQHESGTFTCPDSGTSYTINFDNTYSKYMLFVQATDESKTSIVSSGETGAKSFAFIGIYPKLQINNEELVNQTFTFRIKPSTGAIDDGFPNQSNGYTYMSTSATMPLGAMSSGANYLYRGMSYNYYIAEIV